MMSANDSIFVMQIIEPTEKGNVLSEKRNKKTGIYENLTYNEPKYTFPMPAIDGFSGSYKTNIDGGNNANGDFQGVVISSKVNISGFYWTGLDAQTGRELLAVFAGGENLSFFARYYDVALGEFVIRQFYRGDIEYEINNLTGLSESDLDIDYWKSIRMPVSEV